MDSRNPDELITEVKEEQQTRGELATEALQWFLDGNVGELFPRGDVVDRLSNELDITNRQANTAISDTVGDIVDPVQQIVKGNEKYVGVIDYKIFNDEGAYGYVDFDDRKGQRKRVVCARCVEKHTYDENITHATQGEGSSDVDATWQQLLNKVTSHYATQHTTSPSTIEPGASLVSGTTISGNAAFHAGNESNIDHDNLSNRTHEGDDLTPSSVSSGTLEATNSLTDPTGTTHTGELADLDDIGGAVVGTNFNNIADLPLPDYTEKEIVYVKETNEYAVPSKLQDVRWNSITRDKIISSVLPQSQIKHRFDVTQINASDGDLISSFPNEVGTTDLTSGSEPEYVSNGINGIPVLRFDNDYLDASFNPISKPYFISLVVENGITDGSTGFIFDGFNEQNSLSVSDDAYRVLTSIGIDSTQQQSTYNNNTGVVQPVGFIFKVKRDVERVTASTNRVGLDSTTDAFNITQDIKYSGGSGIVRFNPNKGDKIRMDISVGDGDNIPRNGVTETSNPAFELISSFEEGSTPNTSGFTAFDSISTNIGPVGGNTTTQPTVITVKFDSTTSLRVNGQKIEEGTTTDKPLDGITLGSDFNNNFRGEFDIGEMVIYDKTDSNTVESVESHLANKWGVFTP